jgi:aldehyde dehydrogenase (NAD+)
MRAAAEHLTPVTLELGGKNPTIVDSDVDLDAVCKRISSAKWLNNGQTCVAPDTVYVHSKIADKFTEKMQTILSDWFKDASKSSDWSRIVNSRHAQRVAGLLEGIPKEKIVTGGQSDPSDHYVAPTLVTDPSKDSKLLKEEIFGPIIPILRYDNIDDILPELSNSDYPLAVYIFSNNKTLVDHVIKHTDSGAVTVNDALLQLAIRDLPFGGVGPSGMGRWFREASYNTFTYERGVFNRPLKVDPPLMHRTSSQTLPSCFSCPELDYFCSPIQ